MNGQWQIIGTSYSRQKSRELIEKHEINQKNKQTLMEMKGENKTKKNLQTHQ